MSTKTQRNTTIARVSFFTHALVNNRIDDFDFLSDPGSTMNPRKTSLIGFSYQKTIMASGQVAINLKPLKESFDIFGQQGKKWTDLIHEGDWWMIEVFKNGNRLILSFGVIDRVQFNMDTTSTGAISAVTTVQGRDFSFGPEAMPVYFNPWDPAIDNAAGINMMAVLNDCVGSPNSVVVAILRGLMGVGAGDPTLVGGTWGLIEVPRGLSQIGRVPWGSLLRTNPVATGGTVQDLRGGVVLTNLLSPDTGGSVWDLVKAWSNPCLNEVFIDPSPLLTVFGLPEGKLVMREKPFENLTQGLASPWFKLTTWDVDARLLRSVALSTGNNRVNYIMLTGDLKPVLQENSLGAYPPVVNEASIRRYGLRRIEESTMYQDGESITPPGIPDIAFAAGYREWLFNIMSWNMMNHLQWQGSIVTPELRPEVRIGEKIAIKNAHMAKLPGYPAQLQIDGLDTHFYVEGVSFTYTAGASPVCSTTFTVSRGYQDNLRLPAMTAEAKDWSVQNTTPSPSANNTFRLGVLDAIKEAQLERDAMLIKFEPPFGNVVS